ncbi:MAG TPA: IS21 family transposase [Gemmatimonadales bacterium]|jgi:transposase|nr:IS21 family transposase [Gemmatimonadales bacterium]
MIALLQRAEIRRLFYAEHWPIGTIADALGVHHETVRRAINRDRGIHPGPQIRPSQLDPYKSFIAATLEQYPRLRATRLWAMLRERGYPGSAVQVRRYVRTVRPAARAEAYFRLDTLPGEQGQVDWANFGALQVGHARRGLSCFVLVLSWSRAVYARFALDQTLESFLRGHVEAFAALGGVPRVLLYDNLKSVVLERAGEHIRFHPRLLELAGHYHFAPQPCAVARGNEKGRVERMIQYLRHAFFAARAFPSIEDLNRQLAAWIAETAHQRPVPDDPTGRRVAEALDEERPRLLPLPEHPFACDLVKSVSAGKTPYLRFDGNDYSIPHTLIRRPLTLVASETEVRILDGVTEVARHPRRYDRGQRIEAEGHLAALTAAKRRAHDLRGRAHLRQVCPHADAFLDALARRGERLAPHTMALLRLLDQYDAGELDAALADAVARDALSAWAIAHRLDQRARARRTPPPVPVLVPADPRVRDLRVTPHRLTDYDGLLSPAPEDPDATPA